MFLADRIYYFEICVCIAFFVIDIAYIVYFFKYGSIGHIWREVRAIPEKKKEFDRATHQVAFLKDMLNGYQTRIEKLKEVIENESDIH